MDTGVYCLYPQFMTGTHLPTPPTLPPLPLLVILATGSSWLSPPSGTDQETTDLPLPTHTPGPEAVHIQ